MRLLKMIVDPSVTHSLTGPKWRSISPEARDFVSKCLLKDPDERPSTDEVLQHRWLHMKEAEAQGSIDLSDRVQEFRRAELRRRFRKAVNGVIFSNRMVAFNRDDPAAAAPARVGDGGRGAVGGARPRFGAAVIVFDPV
jgi:serine/threonine protein kinase